MNSRTAPMFRCQVLSALVLLAVMLLVTACGANSEPTSESSTGPETSNGEVASNDSMPSEVADAIEQVTSQPMYERSIWGLSVKDLSTGEVLLDQSSEKLFVPGSILKTFSTATALDSYGSDYRFRTPVYQTDAPGQGVLDGNLVLVASGDLSLGLREQSDGTMAYNSFPELDHTYANNVPIGGLVDGDPLAGLDELARQVHDSGIREVRGDVVIDDRLFEPYSEWPDGLISPIWVNENRIDITTTPTSAGEAADVDWRPKTAAYTVESDVKTAADGEETDLTVDDSGSGVFRISGQIAADSNPALRVGEVEDPAAFARTAFIEALEGAGVEVGTTATGSNPSDLLPSEGSYGESERVAEHISAPLEEFTSVVLKTSHNPGADLMACLIAVEAGSRDCKDGVAQEFEVATGLGVSPDSVFLFDGAGGIEFSRATPDAMTTFLRSVYEQSYGEAFRSSLAELGVNGDVAQIEADSPAAGYIWVKTGTRGEQTPAGQGLLTGRTLVGYVEAESGRELVISIMVGGVSSSSLEDLLPTFETVAEDQGELAAAIQQGY
jgi:D-alanyl-D-alanine carboxypeptidase/D-alanyl-D-alanine-endopeptidase (penicillin-binding protein 4)